MIPTLLVALFLFAHGAIHTGFVSRRPPATAGGPTWPFDLDSSWLGGRVGGAGRLRSVGLALVAVTMVAYGFAGVAALGWLDGAWTVSVVTGSGASLLLLVLFFRPWLTLGVLIDVALLALAFAGWRP